MKGKCGCQKGASALDDYVRVYAAGGKDQIIASYALSSVIRDAAKQECEDLAIDGSAKAVPCVSPVVSAAKPGERIWVSRSGDLPFEDVHGCEVSHWPTRSASGASKSWIAWANAQFSKRPLPPIADVRTMLILPPERRGLR